MLPLGIVWLSGIGVGGHRLMSYQATPGPAGVPAPQSWPPGSRIARTSGRPELVVFLHPRCPCSDATISELEEVLAKTPCAPAVTVCFWHPDDKPASWAESDLLLKVASLQGVCLHSDSGGTEARRFGAETSGTILLYDPAGTLLFCGGITAARGHRGSSVGGSALAELLSGKRDAAGGTPVFGCSLNGSQDSPPGLDPDSGCAR